MPESRCISPLRIGSASPVGYAHFPGTGPTGTACRECKFIHKMGSKRVCLKFSELMTVPSQKCPHINPYSQSCRYFKKGKK